MGDDIKLTRAAHAILIALMLRAFPEYRGRLFRARTRPTVRVSDYWSGGSHTDTTFVDLATGRIIGADAIPRHLWQTQEQGNTYNQLLATMPLQDGIAAIEHVRFCGKDLGLVLVLHPANLQTMLPAAA